MGSGAVEGEEVQDGEGGGLQRLGAYDRGVGIKRGGGGRGVGGEIGTEVLQCRGEDEGYAGRKGEVLEGWVEEAGRRLLRCWWCCRLRWWRVG